MRSVTAWPSTRRWLTAQPERRRPPEFGMPNPDDDSLLCPGGPCIGRFLSTARHHMAINTPASAGSPFVQAEASWTRGGRVARHGECLWRLVRESYPHEPDTFIHAQVQRVVSMNASLCPSLLTTPDFLDVGWVLGGIAPVNEVMARQNAAGAELASRLFWHADDGEGVVGPPDAHGREVRRRA